MKNVSIYKYIDYKAWLNDRLKEEGHGAVTRIAKSIGCQRSYLSQVITSHVHLTPDLCFQLGQILLSSQNEKKFLALLVDHARASDRDYREHLTHEIEKIKQINLRLENAVGREKKIDEQLAQFYYSAWYCSALHIATSLNDKLSASDLAKLLNLDQTVTINCLNELVKFDLVEKRGPYYSFKNGGHHLPKESLLLPHFLTMWRNKAMTHFAERKRNSDIHFTVVQSISKKDFETFQDEIHELIKKFSKMAEPSTPEVVINFNIDFYKFSEIQ